MGQSRQSCDLCRRTPGEPHKSNCARSRFQQARLSALLESQGAPRWLHVSTMLVTDVEIENVGEHTLPADAPRSNAAQEAFYFLPGETYTRPPDPARGLPGTPPGAGGRPSQPKLARFAFLVPKRRAA